MDRVCGLLCCCFLALTIFSSQGVCGGIYGCANGHHLTGCRLLLYFRGLCFVCTMSSRTQLRFCRQWIPFVQDIWVPGCLILECTMPNSTQWCFFLALGTMLPKTGTLLQQWTPCDHNGDHITAMDTMLKQWAPWFRISGYQGIR